MSIFSKIFIGLICGLILFVGLPQIDDSIDVDNLTELVEFEVENEKTKVFTYQSIHSFIYEFNVETFHKFNYKASEFNPPESDIFLPPPKV